MSANMFGFAAGGSLLERAGLGAQPRADGSRRRVVQVVAFDVPKSKAQTSTFALLPEQRPRSDRHAAGRPRRIYFTGIVMQSRFTSTACGSGSSTSTGTTPPTRPSPGRTTRPTTTTWSPPSERGAVAGRQRPRHARLPADDAEPVHEHRRGRVALEQPHGARQLGDTGGGALVPAAGHRRHGRQRAPGVNLEPDSPPTGSCRAWPWTGWATWPSATARLELLVEARHPVRRTAGR